MSAVTGPVGEPIAAAEIAQARSAARAARRRTVDVLEESLALDADGFTARLAATLHLECLPMAELRAAVKTNGRYPVMILQRSAAGLEEDARLTALFLWTIQATASASSATATQDHCGWVSVSAAESISSLLS